MRVVQYRLVPLLLVLASLGCGDGLTEVIVLVDTDLVPGVELDGIAVTVDGADPARAFGAVTSQADLPATVGVVRSGGDLGPVTVRAQALLGVQEVVSREATFTFVEGQTRVLRLNLVASCVGVDCVEGQTCTEDGCQLPFLSEGQLLPYREPLERRDAGPPRDAGDGVDAGDVDAGVPMDAGDVDAGPPTDAGMADAGAPDAGPGGTCMGLPGTCGTGGGACTCASCTCDVQCMSNCEVACSDSTTCNTDARSGSTIDVDCDNSTCSVDATGASNVTIDASNGSDISATCEGTSNCALSCTRSSMCLLRCAGASNCGISRCGVGVTSCPGNVEVCNRACP